MKRKETEAVTAMENRQGPASRSVEGDTRHQVMMLLLKSGPSTASELAGALDMSAPGVRRHLDKLADDALAETVDWSDGTSAGRGRPAKNYQLTDRGRAQFGHSYDTLALEALEALWEIGGTEALQRFARNRIDSMVGEVEPADGSADSVEKTVRALADSFDRHGYAATVTEAGAGVQICQHHCPVANVAAEHPEICEAEHDAISSKVGLHVQPLALISSGDGVCTTNIPLRQTTNTATQNVNKINTERSGS